VRAAAQAAAQTKSELVRAEHLDGAAGTLDEAPQQARPIDVTREQVEAALAEHAGNVSAVARSLKLHRSQLYRLLKQYGLSR
jgi:transcriptional regulator of acetoin/glycerol metabolism